MAVDPTIPVPPARAAAGVPAPRSRGWRYFTTPLVLAALCLLLFLWVRSLPLDSIEARRLNWDFISHALWQHVKLAAISTVLVVVIAVSLGIVLTRPGARRVSPFVLALTNIGQAIPSIGLLVLLGLTLGIGFNYAIIALVVYSILPVLRNTMVGLQQVDRSLIEAGRGMGMTKASVLRRIELPLAVPVILAGIRTALIINVGTATLATFTGAGGLGDLINNGLRLGRDNVIFVGATLTALLALTIDWIASVAEDLLRPKGL
jgi:osmoprotectant transport system permease protein